MTLLATIKNDTNLRKIFGKRELIIIEKQILGVPLKESERTRLSRDIRKKFDAIKELSRFKSEFYLKKGSEIKNMIEEAKEIILQNRLFPKIKEIILFGSAIENKLTLSSDIDLAVKFLDVSRDDASRFRREILGNINKRLDIQVYNMLPKKIKNEIDAKGKILYEKKDKR